MSESNDRASAAEALIQVEHLYTQFGEHVVHEDINLEVYRGEVLGIVGGSGSGKTTLLREMLLLQKPSRGNITLFGKNLTDLDYNNSQFFRQHSGVMFQHGALFSSLTVLENVGFPLREFTKLSYNIIREIALLKIRLVGLDDEAAYKYPAELSGGMIKRVAIARAIVMDPELLFLDEPTAGLDPQGASALDNLIIELKSSLNLTVVMVTHDLDTLWRVADRIVFLGEKKILGIGPMAEVATLEHPLIKQYFSGPRGRAAHAKQSEISN